MSQFTSPENAAFIETVDKDAFANTLLKLLRSVEQAKAELCECFRKKYETCEEYDVDKQLFEDKFLGFADRFDKIRTQYDDNMAKQRKSVGAAGDGGIQSSSSSSSSSWGVKMSRVDMILSCCQCLLSIDREVVDLKLANRSDEYEEVINRYRKFQEQGNKIFDSFPSDDDARKEFPVMEVLARNVNITIADVVVKMKKIFYGNIVWTKNFKETRLVIKCPSPDSNEKWNKVLTTLDKLDHLEELLGRLFNDLVTYFLHPIMKSSLSQIVISGNELTFKQGHLLTQDESMAPKSLWERFCGFLSVLDFVFKRFQEFIGQDFSLIEKLGSKGRGKALFEVASSYLTSKRDLVDLMNPNDQERCFELFGKLLNSFEQHNFVNADEARELSLVVETLSSKPSLYSYILSKAAKLVQENLHFATRVGCYAKNNNNTGTNSCDLSFERSEGIALGFGLSPYHHLFETFEDLLPDEMKFPECSLSLPGSQLVDLFYDALEVDTQHFIQTSDAALTTLNATAATTTILNNTTANTTTTLDSTLNSTLGSSSSSSTTMVNTTFKSATFKGASREPIMKKSTDRDVLRTYRCIQHVVELFMECVPIIHEKDIRDSPLIAALHHNDCLYMAHHLMLLEHHMRPESKKFKKGRGKQPPPISSALPLGLTFIDLLMALKGAAAKSLINYLANRQREIVMLLSVSFEQKGKPSKEKFADIAQTLRETRDKIFYLKKIWAGVLTLDTLNRSLGALLNKFTQTLIDKFVDMAAEVATTRSPVAAAADRKAALAAFVRLCLNFTAEEMGDQLYHDVPGFKPDEALVRNVAKWRKLKELIFVMEPLQSPKRVITRWGSKDEKGGVVSLNRTIVGEIVLLSEAKAFLSLAFAGPHLERILEIFK